MKKKIRGNLAIMITLLVDVVLILAIFYLMNFVQYLLAEDVRINLTEIVTQNKDVISSKLSLEMNNLELEAKLISERFMKLEGDSIEQMDAAFLEYADENNREEMLWALADGNAIDGKGNRIKVYGRSYFQYGMQGIPCISERLISRVTGEDVFVLCVPLYLDGDIIGTLQRQYTPQQIYDICSVSLFSEQASTYIINSQGYIMVCSEKSEYNQEADNYYRILYKDDYEASQQLESDIHSNKAGFMEAVINGEKMFSAYTPIEDIHDWYLITSIPTDAVSPNANVVVKLFYCVLFMAMTFFTFSMVNYWLLKKKQQKRLERLAFVDAVTNGDSYTKFADDLQNILQSHPEKKFALCAIDIDNFKYINSFYGFETGDKILRSIYDKHQAKLRADERIARVNSDHFVMLLSDFTKERLDSLIELEVILDEIKIYLSAGLYRIDNPTERIGLMVDKAGTAAQKGKGLHFKQVEYYSEAVDQKTAQVEQLKRALERALDQHEIIPFFQPKVDIQTRELVGAEALARWRTEDGKLILPGDFIPVCEQTGMVALVDMAIFEQTLQFIRKNREAGVRCVPISVNFSRQHLLNGEFLTVILSKLQEYGVPPEYIEIELTETVIFDNYQTINDFIRQLHACGLKISMDDFGSGYSSLFMLKDVAIDVLKIDRGFLNDSTNSRRQKAVFGAIVQMAANLDIKVIVEGVQTIENVKLMDEFGCSYAQGYYYARPMDSKEFDKIYAEGKVCQKEY